MLGLLLLLPLSLSQAQDFASRAVFPDVATISVEGVQAKRDEIVLIHVGAELDYEMLRILKSVNLPLDHKDFQRLSKGLAEETKLPLVFYCHDEHCLDAYHAARRAKQAGVANVFAFDAGAYHWAKAHPDQVKFLDKTPADTDKLLSDTDFASRCLPPEAFAAKLGSGVSLLDVRDQSATTGGLALIPGASTRYIPLSKTNRIKSFLQRARLRQKTILIYGEDTTQPRPVAYLVEMLGLKEAHFLCGGAKGYLSTL